MKNNYLYYIQVFWKNMNGGNTTTYYTKDHFNKIKDQIKYYTIIEKNNINLK